MKIEIEEVSNGYIITDLTNDDIYNNRELIEHTGTTKDILILLLEKVANLSGLYQYDKFSKENMDIKFNKKGHKV